MANTAPTITIIGRVSRINRGRGLKMVQGNIVLCANSTHQTSGIEKYFRKCHDIKVTVAKADGTKAVMPVWDKSTTNKNGILRTFGTSAANRVFSGNIASAKAINSAMDSFGIACSGTFVAFGS